MTCLKIYLYIKYMMKYYIPIRQIIGISIFIKNKIVFLKKDKGSGRHNQELD